MAPDICPHCGADVPLGARCCPVCGADEATGWSERAERQRLDIPDDDFDYDEFIKNEFDPEQPSPRPRGIPWWAWLAALVLVALLLFLWTAR